MDVKGIIFDFGFTLFYFEQPSIDRYFECFQKGLLKSAEILKKHKILGGDNSIKEFINTFNRKRMKSFKRSIKTKIEIPTSNIFKQTLDLLIERNIIDSFKEFNKKFYNQLADLYHSCEEEEWIPFKNTKDTLEQIFLKNVKIGLISNHPNHKTIEKILEKHDVLKYFDVILTSAKFGKRKPDPDIFFHALEKMELKEHANSVIMCGDEYADIVGAYRANLKAILLERHYKFPLEKEITLSDYIKVTDISEILKYIN